MRLKLNTTDDFYDYCVGGELNRLSVLAFHMALNEVPRKPMVVSAVAVALSLGTGLQKAVAHMRQCCDYADKNGPSLWNELV